MELEGKISAKHYLNKKLKSMLIDGKKCYPLYVRISFQNKFREIKSKAELFWHPNQETDYGKEIKNYLKRKVFLKTEGDIEDYYFSEKDFKENVDREPKLLAEREALIEIIDLNRKNGINIFDKNPKLILAEALTDLISATDAWLKQNLQRALMNLSGEIEFSSLYGVINWDRSFIEIFSTLYLITDPKNKLKDALSKFSGQVESLNMLNQFEFNRGKKIWLYEWNFGILQGQIRDHFKSEIKLEEITSLINNTLRNRKEAVEI